MSVGRFLQQAAAGNAGEAIYVDDLFSTDIDYSGSWGPHTITNGLDLSGEGGMVWTKARDGGTNHWLYDTERGATKALSPDQTSAEGTITYGLTGFTSTGFTFSLSHAPDPNSQVWWSFRKQPGFFDVVTYSGTGSAQNISHNLGSVPGMIIVKNIGRASTYWHVYHRAAGGSYSTNPHNVEMYLNTTDNEQNGVQTWGTTAPTSTQFTIGGSGLGSNYSGDNYVAYLFAHDAQDFGEDSDEAIIKCGSFTTDGSGNASVDLGFEPQWILAKTSASANQWVIVDTMRGLSENGTGTDKHLWANSSNAEMNYAFGHPTSTGFEAKNIGVNQTYIYVAIRRPHKPASKFAATDLFSMDAAGSTSSSPCFVSNGHVVDMAWEKTPSSTGGHLFFQRLTGQKYLNSADSGTESTGSAVQWDYMSGCLDAFSGANSYQAWMFRRAPGFFDVVTYTGTGSDLTVNHNLGVTPELIIVKNRNRSENWPVYHSGDSSNYYFLNTTTGGQSNNRFSSITASSFVAEGGSNDVNSNYNDGHVAYLFATVAGISKVGTYSGTGSDVNVDCGFSSGARFVLIKRSDSTGDWYYYDSVRGIVAGNDPYLFLNTTAAQVTNTDYIDPLSSGFTITSSAPAALNTSGGTYLFLAIA